jgi:ATP-dependent DNA helicase RecG
LSESSEVIVEFLATPLKSLVGGKTATALSSSLGIHTAEDLLRHYPRRYAERGQLTNLRELIDGESATIVAEIKSVTSRSMAAKRGSILEVIVTDGSSEISITFFNQKWRERDLRTGRKGLFAGQVSTYRGRRQLAHPHFELFPDGVDDDPLAVAAYAGAILPIYAASSKTTSWNIAAAVRILLDTMPELIDPIPIEVREKSGLLSINSALRMIHIPQSREEVSESRRTLAFHEAFDLQGVLLLRRSRMAALTAQSRTGSDEGLRADLDARLPYVLTSGQVRVGEEIATDLSSTRPMHRLLQGDVGSGKTLVAVRAMLDVIDAGGQAVLLAPTEVLATQHHRSITSLLGPIAEPGMLGGAQRATKVVLLTGSLRTAERRAALLDIISGDAGIIIGTHSVIQDSVEFHDLALAVIDEQHRFGVEQRAVLASKGSGEFRPHMLVMTATPIPRTIALTAFGDLDVSTLDELPAGRSPITTHIVNPRESAALYARIWERVEEEVAQGHRVFIVCPRIDDEDSESEVIDDDSSRPMASVLGLAEDLADRLPNIVCGVMHGRMSAEEKDDAMQRFRDPASENPIQVLVSTTVIEVGVDVPIATMMVIMDAERFGMSALHQLRGRVGRGGLPGLCLLVSNAESGSPGHARLSAVAATTDGFELAQVDLELRREGDVLGSSQSGLQSSLRLLQVVRDAELIEEARNAVSQVLAEDPGLMTHPELLARLNELDTEQTSFLEKA